MMVASVASSRGLVSRDILVLLLSHLSSRIYIAAVREREGTGV